MIELAKDGLEAKVIKLLQKNYPLTVGELRVKLKLRGLEAERVLKKLGRMGLVGMDVLPDKTYLHLLREDVIFSGVKPTQKKSLVKKVNRKKAGEYEGSMYR